jgi:hypothetical protein
VAVWQLLGATTERGDAGFLMLLFPTGIKKEPNKFFVPRTVMIGGKVTGLGVLDTRVDTWLDGRIREGIGL